MNYINIHQHTDFSLMDGYSTIEDYAERAKDIGMEYLTCTDHGTLANTRNTQQVAKENNLTPVLGMEAYFTHDRTDRRPAKEREENNPVFFHMTVLAKDEAGLKNLQALDREAWSDTSFYSKPRIDTELLQQHHSGLIVASACLGGVLCKAFERGDEDAAYTHASQMKEIFGDDYYIEIMSPNGAEMNGKLLLLADTLGIKPVISDDCHHAKPEDLVAQEAMLILSTNPKVNVDFDLSKSQKMDALERFNYLYPGRKMSFQELDLYLKDAHTHEQNLKAQGIDRTDPISNTMEIAEKIGEYAYHENLDLLPRPQGDPDKILKQLVSVGLTKRGTTTSEYKDRAKRELEVITSKNFSTYFLIVRDAIEWARSQDILVGPGRGSAAGSLICYALGITNVDPLEYDLLFERFLDESRSDFPDIDVDIEDTRRGEVKAYLERKFGNVGNIMTFTSMNGKSLFRDVCRIYKLPYAETDKAAKLIQDVPGDTAKSWDDYKTNPALQAFRKKYPEVEKMGDLLRGRIRSRGVHASGLVISSKPLSEVVSIESVENTEDKTKNRMPVITADMNTAADIGLIKMDFLGLKALGIFGDILRLIEERTGRKIDIETLPMTDPAVFKSIRKGNTAGLFQIEGGAFTKILDEMPMEKFSDMFAATSLIRPGAADSRFGKQFLDFRNKGKMHSIHKDVDWITAETSGVLYQEQLMQLCVHLAGMTGPESNEVRRAVGKKKADKLALWSEKFKDGAAEKIGMKKSEALWRDIEAAANYSFNKSHAVAYSMMTYISAYLKHYYPLEFYLSILKRETDNDKRVEYLVEAKRNGIRVLTPHVNHSDVDIAIKTDEQGDYLRMGLSDIKYVGPAAARKIIDGAPYINYAELRDRAGQKYSGINVRSLESMNFVGAANFPDNPLRGDEKDYFYDYLKIPSLSTGDLKQFTLDRIRPVDGYDKVGTFILMGLVKDVIRKNHWAAVDLIDESGSARIFFNPDDVIEKGEYYIFLIHNGGIVQHMSAEELKNDSPLAKYLTTEIMNPFPDGYRVIAFSSRRTKAQKLMGTLILTDDQFNLKGLLVFPSQYYATYTNAKAGEKVRVETDRTKDGAEFVTVVNNYEDRGNFFE